MSTKVRANTGSSSMARMTVSPSFSSSRSSGTQGLGIEAVGVENTAGTAGSAAAAAGRTGSACAEEGIRSGNTTVKRLPSSTVLSTAMPPPSSSPRRRAIARPRPLPPYLRLVLASICSNAPKMWSSLSAGMPMPVSVTVIATAPSGASPKRRARSVFGRAMSTCTEPSRVNLKALPTRLFAICSRREPSVWSDAGNPSARSTAKASDFSPAT